MVNHMPIPKGVVSEYETALPYHFKCHLVSFAIGTLVAVYECHVEGYAQSWRFCDGITNNKLNLGCHWRLFNPFACKILLFVVNLKGIYLAAVPLSLGHTYGTIAAECADFVDISGVYHSYKLLM